MTLKKVFSLLIISLIIINTTTFGFAISYNNQYTTFKNSLRVIENEKYTPRLNIDYTKYENRNSDNKDGMRLIEPYGSVPMEGDTRITLTDLQTDGVTYEDGSQRDNVLNNIINIGLSISSYFITTVGNVVKDIAILCFSMDWNEVNLTKPGEAILSHSYSYYSKLGQVWNGDFWVTKVDIEARKIYRHEWASFAGIDGYTRTDSYDFIPPNGYNEIGEESKPFFEDDDWIRQEAHDRYVGGLPPFVDAWTH
ncbi:hypothetical protein Y919_12025 [Caloranaerobacter azorensis H53214]|uniref:Uncharacterized protein n=1 Tax=Caloranaerobacter azorensis H53214 TaxID=1156417 RepID=A0A096BF10_9FIRM|nr:hypothetical protein [Caloranaerobacter azorensis]KGG79447.1 hypothetical protein Y919_12025 [Caloranaerobacter azorensis H53214]